MRTVIRDLLAVLSCIAATPQSRGNKRMQGLGIMLAIMGYCILKCGSKNKSDSAVCICIMFPNPTNPCLKRKVTTKTFH
jgi:hypothetical protein